MIREERFSSKQYGYETAFVFGSKKEVLDYLLSKKPGPVGLLVNASARVSESEWKSFFSAALKDSVEWFCAYGPKGEAIHDLWDEVEIDLERNEVVLSIWDKDLSTAKKEFRLIGVSPSSGRLPKCLVMEKA